MCVSVCVCMCVCGCVTLFPWRSGREHFSEDNNKLERSYKTLGMAYSPVNVPRKFGFGLLWGFKDHAVMVPLQSKGMSYE